MNILNIAKKAKLLLNNDITYVILGVTAHCNAKCSHCFYWHNIEKAKFRKHLKIDEFEKLSKNFKELLLINLCGAEPWLRKDLPEIANIFARNNKAKYITIPSNGFLTDLILKGTKKMLKDNPQTFFRFCISIDDIGNAHDKIRGVPGLFNQLCVTAKKMSELKKKYKNFYLVSSTVYSNDTENTILNTIDYIRKNLPFDHNAITYIRGTPKDVRTKEGIDLKKYKEVARNLAEKNNVKRHPMSSVINSISRMTAERVCESEYTKTTVDRPFECFAGSKLLVVDDVGDVAPCEILKTKFGNLRDYNFDLKKMLNEHASKELVQSIKDNKCNCTWECAIQSSIIFNKKEYPKLLKKTLSPYTAGEVLKN